MRGLFILIGGRRIGDNANAHFIGIIDNVIVTVPKNERRRSGAILYGTIQTQLRAFFDVAFCASLDNGIRICKRRRSCSTMCKHMRGGYGAEMNGEVKHFRQCIQLCLHCRTSETFDPYVRMSRKSVNLPILAY